MSDCSNPLCAEVSPEFYKGEVGKCKVCRRAYRLSEAGRVSHLNNRSTTKGLTSHRKRNEKYRTGGHDLKDKAKWLKYNTVNVDTLRDHIFTECEHCVENIGNGSQDCAVANGAEDIKLCPVYQEFKHTGSHPLVNPATCEDDQYPPRKLLRGIQIMRTTRESEIGGRRLDVFMSVARNLSFTKAAEELSMTQPAVTFQIKKLEEFLKTPLFVRANNSIELTDVGEVYMVYGTSQKQNTINLMKELDLQPDPAKECEIDELGKLASRMAISAFKTSISDEVVTEMIRCSGRRFTPSGNLIDCDKERDR